MRLGRKDPSQALPGETMTRFSRKLSITWLLLSRGDTFWISSLQMSWWRRGNGLFETDLEKAYHHMEWELLDFLVERKKGYHSSIFFIVLVDGKVKGLVKT